MIFRNYQDPSCKRSPLSSLLSQRPLRPPITDHLHLHTAHQDQRCHDRNWRWDPPIPTLVLPVQRIDRRREEQDQREEVKRKKEARKGEGISPKRGGMVLQFGGLTPMAFLLPMKQLEEQKVPRTRGDLSQRVVIDRWRGFGGGRNYHHVVCLIGFHKERLLKNQWNQ